MEVLASGCFCAIEKAGKDTAMPVSLPKIR
jgi:hypothetical protein